METKRIIAGIITVVVFAGLIVCPALARRYDTMMVGYDRWIDNGIDQEKAGHPDEIVFYEGDNGEPNGIAFYEGDDEPNEITYYDGEVEPNLVVLLYYPQEHPEHPNGIINNGELDPNMARLFDQFTEHPEDPNEISTEEDIELNLVLIQLKAEHPEHPNEVSSEDELDPNDIEKIILDEGTANLRKEDSILPELS